MNLKELSLLLNLSTTTVSRALNGYPEVNAETRARVIAAAQRHGYAPSQVARRLATGRSHSIGHVIPLSEHQMINPVFADSLAGAGEAYAAAGYDMVLTIVAERDEAEAYRAMAAQRRVDGIFVHGPRLRDPRVEILTALGLPFVMHGRDSRPERDYSWIDINNRRAFRRATDLLLDLGHRRVALLNGLETMYFAQRRRAGYEDALTARGIAPDPSLMREAEMVEPFGHAAVLEMLRLPDPPSAFLTSSIIVAHGVLRAVRELGLVPGRDISIVTHDDALSYLRNDGAIPLFTATRSSIRAAGRRAAEILLARIDNPALPPVHELWEVDLTLGQSTGPKLQE